MNQPQQRQDLVSHGLTETSDFDITKVKPETTGDIIRLAVRVAKTQMIPKAFQGKPDETAVAMLWAREAGVNPITALNHIAVINGKPAWYSDAVPGIAKAKGLITGYEEWMEGEPYQPEWTAFCRVHTPNGMTYTNQFSFEEAKRAKLADKDGPWKLYTRRMMQWRARSWAIRDAAPDAFFGPTAEELHDAIANHHGFDNAKLIPNNPESNLDAFAAQHGKKQQENEAARKAELAPKPKERVQTPGPDSTDDGAPPWPENDDDGMSAPCAPAEEEQTKGPQPDDKVTFWGSEAEPEVSIVFRNLTVALRRAMNKATSIAAVSRIYEQNGKLIACLDDDSRKAVNDYMDERAGVLGND